MVFIAVGAEPQREVARNGVIPASKSFHIQVAPVDGVFESTRMVQMAPYLVIQTRRIAGGVYVEEVAVLTRPNNVQSSASNPMNFCFFLFHRFLKTIHFCSVERLVGPHLL